MPDPTRDALRATVRLLLRALRRHKADWTAEDREAERQAKRVLSREPGRPLDHERQKRAVALRKRGMTLEEIGAELGLTKQGVSAMLKRADHAT